MITRHGEPIDMRAPLVLGAIAGIGVYAWRVFWWGTPRRRG